MKKIICVLLVFIITVTVCSCGKNKTQSFSAEIVPQEVPAADLSEHNSDVTDFSVRLFQNTLSDDPNTLISPFSVMCALSMISNGADGNTLAEVESAFGISIEDLNQYIHTYIESLPQSEKAQLSIANSIWIRNGLDVEQDFLQTNANYYNAEIQSLEFDKTAVKRINNWCEEKTKGMIPHILDDIPNEAMMYLVNAIAFIAEWEKVYESSDVRSDVFTKEDGNTCSVDLMHSTETLYLEDDSATGFIKYYADRSYAFAALLPDEGISIEEYTASLTGEKLSEILSAPITAYEVNAAIPRFKSSYFVEMSDILKNMGINDAFMNSADFSRISESAELFISRILHKTFISVDEQGTKAAAVTLIEAAEESAPEYKEVILNRPFVYVIMDCENNIPLFIGTLTDPEIK